MTSNLAFRVAMEMGDYAAKSLIVLLIAYFAVRLMRRASASIRHMVWLAAFCTLLALPILSAVLPPKFLPVLRETIPPTAARSESRLPEAENPPVHLDFRRLEASPLSLEKVREENHIRSGPHPYTVPTSAETLKSIHPTDWTAAVAVLLAVWLTGVGAVGVKGAMGLMSVWRLRRNAVQPADSSAMVTSARIACKVGVHRRWDLRVSGTEQPPAAMTWGVLRPVVLMPKNSGSWSQERFEAVLLHELAHVRRFDSLSQLIAVAASAFYWFNPATWLCARAMRAEAESAADDTVIRLGVRPSDYANELLQIAAELGHRRQPFAHIGVPVMKQSKIESRVKAILDPTARRRRGVTLIEAIAAAAFVGIAIIPLSIFRAGAASEPAPKISVPKAPNIDLLSSNIQEMAADPQSAPQLQDSAAAERQHQIKLADEAAAVASIQKRLAAVSAQTKAGAKQSDAAQEQKLKAELKVLIEQSQAMRDQLMRTRVELEAARAKLQAERASMEQMRQKKTKLMRQLELDAMVKDKFFNQELLQEKKAWTDKLFERNDMMSRIFEEMRTKDKESLFKKMGPQDKNWPLFKDSIDQKDWEKMIKSMQSNDKWPMFKERGDQDNGSGHSGDQKTMKQMAQLLQAENILAQAKAMADKAAKEFEREKKLYQQGFLSAQDVDSARAAAAVAQANLFAAEAQKKQLKDSKG